MTVLTGSVGADMRFEYDIHIARYVLAMSTHWKMIVDVMIDFVVAHVMPDRFRRGHHFIDNCVIRFVGEMRSEWISSCVY